MKVREFIAIIEREGFEFVRQKGSHRRYQGFVGGQRQLVTVDCHGMNEDITPPNLASMIRQSGLSKSLFKN